jgi:DNA-binding MarR family transcriptional regulator
MPNANDSGSPDDQHQAPTGGPAPEDFSAWVCVYRNVSRLARTVAVAYDAALAPSGLTSHQYTLLKTLIENGPQTVGQLAAELDMDPSGIPRALRPLQQRGYAEVAHGSDRRQRVISLTRDGHAVMVKAEPYWREAQSAVYASFPAPRWKTCRSELGELRGAASRLPRRGAVEDI